jgi:hypothetical protein
MWELLQKLSGWPTYKANSTCRVTALLPRRSAELDAQGEMASRLPSEFNSW